MQASSTVVWLLLYIIWNMNKQTKNNNIMQTLSERKQVHAQKKGMNPYKNNKDKGRDFNLNRP